jgi:hypothetical protein
MTTENPRYTMIRALIKAVVLVANHRYGATIQSHLHTHLIRHQQRITARPGLTPAQLVVRAVYDKWTLQIERWADYRSLFGLLAFIAIFLGVLHAQRGAATAYAVHSTIASVVLPDVSELSSVDNVHDWLQRLIQARTRGVGNTVLAESWPSHAPHTTNTTSLTAA